MIARVLAMIDELFKWYQLPGSMKEECAANVARLHSSSALKHSSKRSASTSRLSLVPSDNQVVSLFQSLPKPMERERKAVGHWCMQSAAAAREERIRKIERSYESDFGSALNMDNTVDRLDSYLAQSFQSAALNRYMRNSNASVSTVSLFRHEEVSSEGIAMTRLEETLYNMARDEDAGIRMSIASNEHAPHTVQWLLSDDVSTEVRFALLQNPSLAYNVLSKLASDADGRVARKAQSMLRKIDSTEQGIAMGNLDATEDRSVDISSHAVIPESKAS